MISQVSIVESFRVSSLLTRTGAATQPGHANPTYLLDGYCGLLPGTLQKRKENNPNIAQKAGACRGEDEDIVSKCFDSQGLL